MAQDAVALIKADHRRVEQLFREFEEAGDRAYRTRQRLVSQLIRELEVHATIEEETYYPAVEAKAKKDAASGSSAPADPAFRRPPSVYTQRR
jgi:hemerythrin superfamily protein